MSPGVEAAGCRQQQLRNVLSRVVVRGAVRGIGVRYVVRSAVVCGVVVRVGGCTLQSAVLSCAV